MCLGGGTREVIKAAEAPPAPEPTPEEVITSEDTTAKSNDRKTRKAKATGLDSYKTDLGLAGDKGGLNVPR